MTFLVVGEVAGARPGMGRVCGPSQEQAFGGMVTVSVIVPVYNTSERLAACLDALLAQTFRDFEVILVNDGSTDCSGDICREYVSRHPQVFRLLDGPNGGVSVARNRGLDPARGEWVAFCDSDDEALPEWLETLHRNAVRDGADLSYCSFDDISPRETRHRCSFPMEGQTTVRLKGREELERRLLLPLLRGTRTVHGYLFTALFRREVIEAHQVRFAKGVSMKEDELFYIDYLQWAESVTAEDRPLYRYLRFGQSACGTYYGRDGNDYRRERNWSLWTRECLRLVEKGELLSRHAWLRPRLRLRCYLHEVQEVCCEPGVCPLERLGRLGRVASRARGETLPLSGMSRGERLFWLTLCHAWWLLPLMCGARRRWESWRRRRGGDPG